MKRLCWTVVSILCCALPGKSDVIVFKNGDQLTGTWVRVQDGKVVFNSENLGEVSIPVAKMQSFSAAKPAVMILKGGQTIRGELSLAASGEWEVRAEGEAKTLASSGAEAIYPQELYEQKSSARGFRPLNNWKGNGDFGTSLVRGDRQAATISVGVNATRRQPDLPGLTERWRTNYFLTTLFATTRRIPGARTSANSFSSGLRQDFLFTPYNFVFLLAQLDHIQAQSLDLRQIYGIGLGRDLVRSRRIALNLLGGTTLVKERFQNGIRRQNIEALAGEKLALQLFEGVSVEHRLSFYPNLSETGEYRVDTYSSLRARVSSRLSFNLGFTSRYLSQPLPGRRNAEIIVTTGFGYRF